MIDQCIEDFIPRPENKLPPPPPPRTMIEKHKLPEMGWITIHHVGSENIHFTDIDGNHFYCKVEI